MSSAASFSTSAGASRSSSAPTARRQRVLWDSDSSTRGGKTSIGILLEWLTTPGNYARWRDGKSQTGETRETLCSEIKNNMRQHGIHHRENANIRTQISELERSFDAARTWLKENSLDPYAFKRVAEDATDEETAAVDAGQGPAEVHVLRMCRYYHVLNDVFGQEDDKGARARRSYHPRTSLYPVPIRKRKLPGEEDVQELDPKTTAAETAAEEPRVQLGVQSVPVAETVSTPVGAAASLAVSGALQNAGLTATWTNPAALESTQRMLAEAVREERERKRFCMEEERNKLECEKLRYEVEAAKLKLTIDRALARRKLMDAGLPEAQVNELFPK
ncbi:hypothetical protein PRNP1_000112 [Phytophthora ramorum]